MNVKDRRLSRERGLLHLHSRNPFLHRIKSIGQDRTPRAYPTGNMLSGTHGYAPMDAVEHSTRARIILPSLVQREIMESAPRVRRLIRCDGAALVRCRLLCWTTCPFGVSGAILFANLRRVWRGAALRDIGARDPQVLALRTLCASAQILSDRSANLLIARTRQRSKQRWRPGSRFAA